MKKTIIYIISFFALQIGLYNISNAQDMPQFHLKPAPATVVVDGDVKEWGDSLSYYSPEERLKYTIANNKDTLYLAVKIFDRSEIVRVLNAGLTFSIDTRGKKKETFSLTYPLNVGGGNKMIINRSPGENEVVSQEERDQLEQEKITTLRGIKVIGYKDVEDDMITTSNTYGIRTAVNYDDAGNLIYEEAIPLKFFHADLTGLWAFDIKINGIQRPQPTSTDGESNNGGGGGRNGGGGMGGGGRHGGGRGGNKGGGNAMANAGETSKTVDFWGKFYLAK
ncbi:hypothetical protein [Mucilaginibacter sp.]